MGQADFMIGTTLQQDMAIISFGSRIRVINADTWYLTGFIKWQYGELRTSNNFHRSLRVALGSYGISDFWGSPAPDSAPAEPLRMGRESLTLSLKTKVKDNNTGLYDFNKVWERYPKKLGRKEAERHFYASIKNQKDWLDIQNALDNYIADIRKEHTDPQYVQHGSTWFNNWRDHVAYRGVTVPKPPPPPARVPEPPPPDFTQEELDELHRDTFGKLGICRTPDCRVCKKKEAV